MPVVEFIIGTNNYSAFPVETCWSVVDDRRRSVCPGVFGLSVH